MIRLALSITLVICLAGPEALAANPKMKMTSLYLEDEQTDLKGVKNNSVAAKELEEYRNKMADADYYNGPDQIKKTFSGFSDKVTPPGFISSIPMNRIATIVGPDFDHTAFLLGDTLYLRWTGAPGPRVGDVYATYKPMIVMQYIHDPTQFNVRSPIEPGESVPKSMRIAGYFYETNSHIKITKITQGLVQAVLLRANGPVALGDSIMQLIPTVKKLDISKSGVQIAAAVVCGSPPERISTSKRSFLYINRGARDGMRVGRVLESVESVKLDSVTNPVGPEVSLGEAVIVHVTESWSTVMITKQFDVIRMGSLLKTKVYGEESDPKVIYSNYNKEKSNVKDPFYEDFKEVPEVPAVPRDKPILSELDELERSQTLRPLTESEKDRLKRLSKQNSPNGETLDGTDPLDLLDKETDTPRLPQIDNSFKQGKETAKKDLKKKKKKKTNDEEELNLLMMQN